MKGRGVTPTTSGLWSPTRHGHQPTIASTLEAPEAALPPLVRLEPDQPWFVAYIASTKEHWRYVALCGPEIEGEIFMIMFGVQSPQKVWFLECIQQPRVITGGEYTNGNEDWPWATRLWKFMLA